jgi:hypothetical protein
MEKLLKRGKEILTYELTISELKPVYYFILFYLFICVQGVIAFLRRNPNKIQLNLIIPAYL